MYWHEVADCCKCAAQLKLLIVICDQSEPLNEWPRPKVLEKDDNDYSMTIGSLLSTKQK